MTTTLHAGVWGRIGTTAFFLWICLFELRQCGSAFSGREIPKPSYWDVAVYAFFALTSWLIAGRVRPASDRVSSAFIGLLFAIKIGMHFVKSDWELALLIAGCAAIVVGLISTIVGLIFAFSQKEPEVAC
jgi:hypothetical protein